MSDELEKSKKDQLRVEINGSVFDFPKCSRVEGKARYITPCRRKLTENDMIELCHKMPKWFKRIARNQAGGYEMLKDRKKAFSNIEVIG